MFINIIVTAFFYDCVKFWRILKMKNNINNQENQRIRLYEPDGEQVGADYGYLEDYDD